jgi:hypothetical protein
MRPAAGLNTSWESSWAARAARCARSRLAGTDFGHLGPQLGPLPINRGDVRPVAQIEVLGPHPERAVAGDHIVFAKVVQGLQLFFHGPVGGGHLLAPAHQGLVLEKERPALGGHALHLPIDGLELGLGHLGIWDHRAAAGSGLPHPVEGEQELAPIDRAPHLDPDLLHLPRPPGKEGPAAFRCHEQTAAPHLYGDPRCGRPKGREQANDCHGQNSGEAMQRARLSRRGFGSGFRFGRNQTG